MMFSECCLFCNRFFGTQSVSNLTERFSRGAIGEELSEEPVVARITG